MSIFSSLFFSLFLSSFLLVIAIAIKLESHGPVFYASERIGQKRTHLPGCYKFRTMVRDGKNAALNSEPILNERDGVLFKITNDPRITRIGRFLRKILSTSCHSSSTC